MLIGNIPTREDNHQTYEYSYVMFLNLINGTVTKRIDLLVDTVTDYLPEGPYPWEGESGSFFGSLLFPETKTKSPN